MIKLSETQKVRLSALADAILPASPTMPSAGRIMNGDGAIECVMRARPDLLVPLAALLDTNTDRTLPEFLETLATQDPESFSV